MLRTRSLGRSFARFVVPALFAAACAKDRAVAPASPVYDADVAPIFARRCVACHTGASPAGGWNAASYLGAIACVAPSGAPATLPSSGGAPVLAAMSTAPHLGVLDADERAVVEAWIAGGTPARARGVHAPGIVDPRSDAWHGKVLRDARWAPMLDASEPGACGACHDGAPTSRPSVTGAASSALPGATSCTTCHTEPNGALACSTCHGSGTRGYPPRDPCFFPADSAKAGAHAAHVEASATHAAGISCATCHPPVASSGTDVIGGSHGNGSVDVVFDPGLAAREASFDRNTRACAVACHDRAGARPRPSWTDAKPMGCNDCHGSPPAKHYPGACTACHVEANATGTSLTRASLHLNGRVDLGDGSGKCGACHGKGDDPWPSTAAHSAHANPTLTVPVDCAACHVVPAAILAPGHLDGVAKVTFGGRAVDRGASPVFAGGSCSGVACHGANLTDAPAVLPAWTDTSGSAKACGACHGLPPTQHSPSTSCERSTCHGAEVARSASGVPSITTTGLSAHINGSIDAIR